MSDIGSTKVLPITPEWCERMAELEEDHEIGAGVGAIPGMLASMWARRYSISDKEWREAGPALLGMALHGISESTPVLAQHGEVERLTNLLRSVPLHCCPNDVRDNIRAVLSPSCDAVSN